MPFWWPVSPWVIDGITCSDGSQNLIPHGITNSRLFRSLCVIQLFLSWEFSAVRMQSRALKHAGRVGWYETTGTVGLQLLPPQKEMSIKDGLSWRKLARRVWFCQSRVQKCETASENDSVTLFSHLKTFLFSSYFINTSVWGKNTILVFILEKHLLTPLVFVKPEDHVILHDLRMFQDSLVFQWKQEHLTL